jgi:acyl-CoA thioester hydrolase
VNEVVTTELEVRWGECDPAGIVYHPAYIDWFSVARMHWLREHGVKYMEDFHDQGIVVVVLAVNCRYVKTLRAEDQVRVDARLAKLSRTRMEFHYQVFNAAGELCAEGMTEHAYVDERGRAVNIAKRAPALWERLHAMV